LKTKRLEKKTKQLLKKPSVPLKKIVQNEENTTFEKNSSVPKRKNVWTKILYLRENTFEKTSVPNRINNSKSSVL